VPGYLCLDDVVVEKAFAKRLPWAGWTYSFANNRKVYGMHIVVVLWCSADGGWRIPVALRLWRPKRSCAPAGYRTKLQLAAGILTELVAARLPFAYLVMDTHYTAGWFTRLTGRLGICWVGTLPPRTTVIWGGRRQPVAELAERLRLAWRPRLGLRAAAVTVYAPRYSRLRLVVTRNRHGNHDYLVTHELGADLTRVVERKRSRWSVETIFRDAKQYAGLGACQCWTDQAMVRHVALVLVGLVVLQELRVDPAESIAAVKQRWQLAITRQEEPPPAPQGLPCSSPGDRVTPVTESLGCAGLKARAMASEGHSPSAAASGVPPNAGMDRRFAARSPTEEPARTSTLS
jgi:DDE superfamily endonuclease